MNRPGAFLTAEWKHLLMLNYAIDPAMLAPLVPAGTELDSHEGTTYLSLIGFEFNRTRLRGVKVPFHQSFEEVNLRFYVRRGDRRGVVFIRELVPKFAVAAMARVVFNENYSSVPMSHRIGLDVNGNVIAAEYAWGRKTDRCAMRFETESKSYVPPPGSLSEFITEHYWGYAAQKNGSSLEYDVKHPQWRVRSAERCGFSGDATRVFGAQFAEVLRRTPDSGFLAEGSEVTVFRGVRLVA
ncbi:MAG TPA: DUF2071 domain-containing protein [Terracidiphilus sp.]|jgi:hypothetical protein